VKTATRMLCGGFVISLLVVAGVPAAAQDAQLQELVNVKASGKFDRVIWLRGPKRYSLQFVPLRPVRVTAPVAPDSQPGMDRSGFFVGSTVANLRGLDPKFDDPPRVLTLVDGRRMTSDQQMPEPVIQVWLLRADGTQVVASWDQRYKLYSVPAVEAVQVVAAAIQVDGEYYIERIQPLESRPAAP
jgi:hypothetical protein